MSGRGRRTVQILCDSPVCPRNLFEATWLLSLTHSGTDLHRELLCLAVYEHVLENPIPFEDQGGGLSTWRRHKHQKYHRLCLSFPTPSNVGSSDGSRTSGTAVPGCQHRLVTAEPHSESGSRPGECSAITMLPFSTLYSTDFRWPCSQQVLLIMVANIIVLC